MIRVTEEVLSPEPAVREAATPGSGCVVTYVGLIRDTSRGKAVRSVTYRDSDGTAAAQLRAIADEAREDYPVENVAIHHRTGVLKVGDINLVVAVAAAHRGEGLAAVAHIVDRFKEKLPTAKLETYTDGTTYGGD
jgi:molybdopterin synthase catalytic subunit